MVSHLRAKPPTRRDQVDAVRLKAAGSPSHINAHEAALLAREMPEAAGPVITRGLLAKAGIRGDDRVTNLVPAEQKLLRRHGGSGDRNPNTGLLQFEDDSGTGNPGGGHDASAAGGPGGGYGGGIGSSVGSGGNYSSNYSSGVGYGFSDPTAGLSYGDISNFGGLGRNTIGPGGTMDSFASPIGALTNAGLEEGYAPLDTLYRLLQTAVFGRPKTYSIGPPTAGMPGRLGAPTGRGPGIARTAAGMIGGPAISGLMTVGGWMRDSMSPETQEKSMAANQAQGSRNSGGNQGGFGSGASQTAAGTSSGARTAGLLDIDPGGIVDPSGSDAGGGSAGNGVVLPGSIDTGGARSSTLTGLPQPVQNLLLDYIWRGRQGTGSGW